MQRAFNHFLDADKISLLLKEINKYRPYLESGTNKLKFKKQADKKLLILYRYLLLPLYKMKILIFQGDPNKLKLVFKASPSISLRVLQIPLCSDKYSVCAVEAINGASGPIMPMNVLQGCLSIRVSTKNRDVVTISIEEQIKLLESLYEGYEEPEEVISPELMLTP